MAKETISQMEGLCKKVANCIRDAYDRGYKQGFKDGNYDKEFYCNLNFEHGTYKGLDDAWECAKKLACEKTEGGFDFKELKEIFDGNILTADILQNYSASEAVKRVKAWEEKQKAEDTDSDRVTRHSKKDMTELEKWKNDFKGFINELSMPKDDYNGIMEYIDEVPNEGR